MTSVVPIQDVPPYTQSIASNAQTVFDTNWTADDDADVVVYARADGSDADDVADLISSADYTISYVGVDEEVRVTFLVGRTLDDIVTIMRMTPVDRLNLYTNTNFTTSMLNGDFGKQTMMIQEREYCDDRLAPKYNNNAAVQDVIDTIVPILGSRQGWRKNAGNTAIEVYNLPDGDVAPADAKYLVQTADGDLPNAQAMGALASGLVVNTATTGVQLTRTLTGTASEIDVSNGTGISGNPTVGISDNPVIPGTAGMGIPQGTTAQRVIPVSGIGLRYNTTIPALEFYELGSWVQLDDADLSLYLLKSGGTMTGNIDMGANKIDSSYVPIAGNNLTNKTYVDASAGVNPLTTKGDLYTFTTVSARLAVGSTNGQLLQVKSTEASGLVYTTATYPETTTINQLLYSSATNTVGGLATGNDGALITSGAGVPSISSTLPTAVQDNITRLGAQAEALNMNTNLINNVVDPVANQDAATKFYVDQTALNGTSVYAASAASLGTVTQAGAGVGATLTNAGVQAALVLDGVSPAANVNVLIKNTATGMTDANEGIYTVTDAGSAITNWVLTRATSYNTPTEIDNTGLITVRNGSTLAGTQWYNSATIVTVDTTSFSYSQFGSTFLSSTLADGKIFRGNVSNLAVASTASYPNVATATGAMMYADGTDWIASTSLWPNTVGTVGKILRSNGTLNTYTTATYPDTAGTVGNIMTSDGTNFLSSAPAPATGFEASLLLGGM